MNLQSRWFIAIMATSVHLCLGTVYAWSFFQKTISETFGWSNSETVWAFSVSIFMLGITAAWGGNNIAKFGTRKLAVIGAFLYALGYIISYFALKMHALPLLYLGFGVVGGIGLGLAYVVPVATASKWFPDKQGMVTGMVVMGFGFGALVMSKMLSPFFLRLFGNNLPETFLAIGLTLLVLLPSFAYFLVLPKSYSANKNAKSTEKNNVFYLVLSPKFIIIWLIFTFNIIAGMIFISFQSPLYQDLLKIASIQTDAYALEQKGATLIAISALFNGLGRIFWGSISDKIGRIVTFRILLIIQLLVFVGMIFTKNPLFFAIGVCIILLCYGGGFGVMPSLVKDSFGEKPMSAIYGLMLTGWGIGGIIGPQITAYMKDHFAGEAGAYAYKIALILIFSGLIASFFTKQNAIKLKT